MFEMSEWESTQIGMAPSRSRELVVAIQVLSGIITLSPQDTPNA